MMKRRIDIIGLCLIITGCDVMYGTLRKAPLPSVPSLDCVQRVVESTPGIIKVNYSHDEAGTAVTLSGLKSPASITYNYFYRGEEDTHIIGVLQIHKDYRGIVSLSQNLFDINKKPPQSDIDASRPVMAHIEQHLESECGMTGLVASIKETCRGVTCSPIAPHDKTVQPTTKKE
jgi:hypothetical protein